MKRTQTNSKSLANLKPCKPGETHNPNGRPRNVFKHLKNQYELSADDLSSLITYMMSLPVEGLKEIIKNPETPVLQATIASAIVAGLKAGDMGAVNILLDRLLGKAKQTVDNNLNITNPPTYKVVFEESHIDDSSGNQITSEVSNSTKPEQTV